MTFIAESPREAGAPGAVRLVMTALLLALGALLTPLSWPWVVQWFTVPVALAATLALTWRFGRPALALPAALLLVALGLSVAGGPARVPLWVGAWTPLGAIAGAWMGLREEGGGPSIGDRAWMLAPMLGLAAALPLLPGFAEAVGRLESRSRVEEARVLEAVQASGAAPEWVEFLRQSSRVTVEQRRRMLMVSVPNMLFLWMALLVGAGRTLAARATGLLRWPPLSRSPLRLWRLPDPALVPLLAGIALFVLADRRWHPSAAALLAPSVLGYSVQGYAVVEYVMNARGVPPVFVALTRVFVLVVSLWVLPAVAVLGLSDVWQDYRRLEPSPAGEA